MPVQLFTRKKMMRRLLRIEKHESFTPFYGKLLSLSGQKLESIDLIDRVINITRRSCSKTELMHYIPYMIPDLLKAMIIGKNEASYTVAQLEDLNDYLPSNAELFDWQSSEYLLSNKEEENTFRQAYQFLDLWEKYVKVCNTWPDKPWDYTQNIRRDSDLSGRYWFQTTRGILLRVTTDAPEYLITPWGVWPCFGFAMGHSTRATDWILSHFNVIQYHWLSIGSDPRDRVKVYAITRIGKQKLPLPIIRGENISDGLRAERWNWLQRSKK